MRPSPAPGTASFPRSESDLRSTDQCPACFTPLRAVVCHACGLNLAHPLAAELATLSTTIADQLDARLRLIDRMRREPVAPAAPPEAAAPSTPPTPSARAAATAATAVDAPVPAPVVPVSETTDPPPNPEPVAAQTAESAPMAPPIMAPLSTPAPEPAIDVRPRRSGIQIALVVVGIALLSVFALFGVIYVFIAYGVVARSVIIALASLATLVVATVLARRGLGATAEGLAALGTVVVLLDAWAVRRTDVAGLASVPETGYWGGALLVSAAVMLVWARLGGHRSPLLVGANLIPIGAALIAVRAASELSRGAATSVAALAAAAATVAVLVVGRRAFRASHTSVVAAAAVRTPLVGLLVAAVAALAGVSGVSTSGWWWGASVAVGVTALIAVAAWLLTRSPVAPLDTVIAATLAAVGALVLLAGLVVAAASTGSEAGTLALAVLAPVTLISMADIARMRTPAHPERLAIGAAAISAGAVGAVAVTVAFVALLTPLAEAVAFHTGDRADTSADVLGVTAFEVTALGALAAAVALLIATSRLTGRLHDPTRALTLAASAGLVLTLTPAIMPTWWALMSSAAIVSIGAAGALVLRQSRGNEINRRAARLGLSIGSVGAAVVAACLGWAVDGGWWLGIVITLAALAVGRGASANPTARSIASAVAGLLVVASTPSIASLAGLNAIALTLTVVAVVVTLGRALSPEPAERSLLDVSLIPVGVTLAISQIIVTPATASPMPSASALLFLLAVVFVSADGRGAYGRYAGLAVVAAAAVSLIDRVVIDSIAASSISAAVSTHERTIVALAVVTLVAAATAMTVGGATRRWLDGGTAVILVVALPVAVAGDPGPLALLIASVGTLALATRAWSAPGSVARLLASVATLTLAVAAVAIGLTDVTARDQTTTVLLIGALLLVTAVALYRRTPAQGRSRALPAAVAALVVVALGPSAAVALRLDAAATTVILAAIVVGFTRLPRRSVAERAATAAATLPIALVLALTIVLDGTDRTVLAGTAVLALLGVLVVLITDARAGIDRTAAFATLGLATAFATAQALRAALALGDDVLPVTDAQLALAVLSAMTVLAVISALTVQGRDRLTLDIGLAVIALPTALVVAAAGQTSLALTISTVLLLALAISRDGLFGSHSPRRFLGWLALVTATIALWSLLAGRGVDNPELYTLPLAGALLAIALLLARVPTPITPARSVSGPTIIAVSALAVAGLPLAALSGYGPVARGASVGVVATALVLAVIVGRVHSGFRWQGLPPLLLGVAVATQLVLALSVATRVTLEAPGLGGAPVDVPLQVASILVVIMLIGTAAAAWATLSRTDDSHVPRIVAETTAAMAGAAALVAGMIGAVGAMEQVEMISIPLALGLLFIGTFELDRRPTARSLPWLTPGLGVLLAPSLIAVDVDGGPWRIAALGIAATVILVGGVVRRLQAPFLVGMIVLLVHVGIQTWPLIAQIGQSIEWWLWLGIAGVVIVAVAARYERRVQNVKDTVRRISELR